MRDVVEWKKKRKNNSKIILVIKNKVSTFALRFERGVVNKKIAKGKMIRFDSGMLTKGNESVTERYLK